MTESLKTDRGHEKPSILLLSIQYSHFHVDIVSGTIIERVSMSRIDGLQDDAHDSLSANGADLDLDVDDTQGLCADVDLDQTGIDRLVELTES
jgi:hypothetical protein